MTGKNPPAAGTARTGAQLMATTLAVGVGVVALIFAAFTYHYDRTARLNRNAEIKNYVSAIGRTTAWGVDKWLSERVRLISGLAEELSASEDSEGTVRLLKESIYQNTFLWTYFGETDGAYHIWPLDDALPADYDPRTRPWYLTAVAGGGATLTEPYRDISTDIETITAATPVIRDGRLAGVVAADFTTDQLNAILAESDLGGLGYAFLVSADGKILVHPDAGMIGAALSSQFKNLNNLDAEAIRTTDASGAGKIVFFTRASENPLVDWKLALVVDEQKAYVGLEEFRRSAAVAASIAMLLTIAMLGFVTHRMLVRPLLRARAAADAASAAKSEFLASMSHEIRTPMNGVLGIAEVLLNTKLDARQRELTSIIVSSGSALMTVINDILDFSKMEAGKLRLNPQSFNFRQAVYDVATLMQARAVEKELELVVRYAPDLAEGVIADESRLRQVIGNLIGNAVKFTEHGYIMVNVTGERLGDKAEIIVNVVDTGIGIKDADIPRMFEKFEQADGSHTRKFGGTGLGLAISRKILDLMGGEINAESEVGKGSRFWFRFTAPIDDSVRALPKTGTGAFSGARILAVDDNEVNRRVVEEYAAAWGMRADIVDGAVGAIDALEKSVRSGERYHAILMDFQMPGENGASLTARIQQDKRFAQIPVILLTSVDTALAQAENDSAAFAASISKPVRPSQLMDLLTRILSEESSRAFSETLGDMKPTPKDCRPRLLVAEDNVVNQMVIRTMISEADYDLAFADNGRIAVEMFLADRPAAVLMDISMPEMDGLEATRQIRAIEREHGFSATPIIAATAHVLEEDRDRCRLAGMDDFIAKPIRKPSLDETLEKWVHQAIEWDDRATA